MTRFSIAQINAYVQAKAPKELEEEIEDLMASDEDFCQLIINKKKDFEVLKKSLPTLRVPQDEVESVLKEFKSIRNHFRTNIDRKSIMNQLRQAFSLKW